MSQVTSSHPREQAILGLLHELEAMPRSALLINDVSVRCARLETLGALLDQMQRMLTTDGQRKSYEHLRGVWAQERARAEQALNRPFMTSAALGLLEERWLSSNPDHVLDLRPRIALVLSDPTDPNVRIALRAYVVSEGQLVNATRSIPYWFLVAPAWFASLLPCAVDNRLLGLTGPEARTDEGFTTQLALDELTGPEIETLTALWSDDVHAELFSLPALLESVLALRHLDSVNNTDCSER